MDEMKPHYIPLNILLSFSIQRILKGKWLGMLLHVVFNIKQQSSRTCWHWAAQLTRYKRVLTQQQIGIQVNIPLLMRAFFASVIHFLLVSPCFVPVSPSRHRVAHNDGHHSFAVCH